MAYTGRHSFIRLLCQRVVLHESCRTRVPAQKSTRTRVPSQERPRKRLVWKTTQNLNSPHKSGRTRYQGGAAQETLPRPRTKDNAGFRTRETSTIGGTRNQKSKCHNGRKAIMCFLCQPMLMTEGNFPLIFNMYYVSNFCA